MDSIEQNYQDTLDYLYRFVDFSLTRSFQFSDDQFNLERMRTLLHLMGDPQERFKAVHIAGTKGKGSVSAFLANILKVNGYRTGLYTSPHLQDYNERIQVDGQPIGHQVFVELVSEIKDNFTKINSLSTFEITTAIAFYYFARREVDVAVIEVGLGGRLDATNVITPLVSVITSISYDHIHILGNTLPKITKEKCGIIKPGRPVVVSKQRPEVKRVIRKIALQRNSPIMEADQAFQATRLEYSLCGQTFSIKEKKNRKNQPQTYSIPLLGQHQIENAVTAISVLTELEKEGYSFDPEKVSLGLKTVYWPARFEVLRLKPPLIIDSAHNRDSAARLRQTLEDYLPGKKVILIFGVSMDKDVDGMLAELQGSIEKVVLTQSIHPRAMDPQVLVDVCKKYDIPAITQAPVELALKTAMDLAGEDKVILAAGSLFLSAAVRAEWTKMGLPLRTG